MLKGFANAGRTQPALPVRSEPIPVVPPRGGGVVATTAPAVKSPEPGISAELAEAPAKSSAAPASFDVGVWDTLSAPPAIESRIAPKEPRPAPATPVPAPSAAPTSATPPAVPSTSASAASAPRGVSVKAAALPVLSIETTAPPEINTGKNATFRIAVQNLGDTTAVGLVVQSSWPKAGRLISSQPSAATSSDSTVVFPARDLEPCGEAVYLVELSSTSQGELDVTTNVHFDTRTQSRLRVCRPSLAVDYAGPERVKIGETTALTVQVKNDGDGPAQSIRLDVPTPSGATVQSPRHEIDRLLPGETRQIPVTIVPNVAGQLSLKFLAAGADGLQAQAERKLHVLSPQLAVDIRGPKHGLLKRALPYTLQVKNAGDLDAENVELLLAIPAGLQVTEVGRDGQFDRRTNLLTWALRKLAVNGTEEFTFRLTALDDGRQPLNARAVPQYGREAQSEHFVEVSSRPDLALSLDYDHGQLEVGAPVEFSVTVRNRGTKGADGVQVAVQLPPGVETLESNGLRFSPFNLPAGEENRFRFRVVGRQPGDHVIRTTLKSDSVACEVIREESVYCYATA